MHSCQVHHGDKRDTGSNANSIEKDLADINNLIEMDIGHSSEIRGLCST